MLKLPLGPVMVTVGLMWLQVEQLGCLHGVVPVCCVVVFCSGARVLETK